MVLPVARVIAVAGASVSLYGCGSGPDPEPAPAPPAPPAPGPVQTAWDNHFAAFAKANDAGLDQIMLDYTDESVVSVFNDNCDGQRSNGEGFTEYKDLGAIRHFFKTLFAQLKNDISPDGSNVVATGAKVEGGPGPAVTEEAKGEIASANVFLTWTADKADKVIDWATDTFSFNKEGELMRIHKQNIVAKDATACAASSTVTSTKDGDGNDVINSQNIGDLKTHLNKCADTASTGLCGAWNNHFGAFGANRLEADNDPALPWIMKDYNDASVVQVFDAREKKVEVHTGTAAIKAMFTKLFADLEVDGTKNKDLDVKLLEVHPETNTVFLVWVSAGVPQATDTFIFDKTEPTPMIITQNIQIVSKARQQMVV